MSCTDIVAVERLLAAGKLHQAEILGRELLDSFPGDSEAFHIVGTVAFTRRKYAEAVALFERALTLNPAAAIVYCDLAAALGKSGHPAKAVAILQRALPLQGRLPELHNNLGVALDQLGRVAEAIAAFRNALKLRPDFPEAHCNLSRTLKKKGDVIEAADSARQALRLRPDFLEAYQQLISLLADSGELEELIGCYRQMLKLDPNSPGTRSALLYTLHYDAKADPATLFNEHRAWDQIFGRSLLSRRKPHTNERSDRRRLRIGYVSPDFRTHTVPRFIEGALTHHDKGRFDVFLYSDVARPDVTTRRLQALGHTWREIRKHSNSQVAESIRSDSIDILVDLRGHGGGNRMPLFAMKPAPLQMNMVGYFDTTGLAAMDYRLTDSHQDPPGKSEEFHSEQLLRMRETCWCYRPDDVCPPVIRSPFEQNGYITFGSLNKIIKLTPRCAAVWKQVLVLVPRSRLLLSTAPAVTQIVADRLVQWDFPADRVDIVPKAASRENYLERYGDIDIALDTYPFNGITTTCDGLWMGVPHITLQGDTSVSRAGASILRSVGLNELVCDDPESFVKASAKLAHETDRLRDLRSRMRQRMSESALTDQPTFTRKLERFYAGMWHSYITA